jgi:uncharacterized repeat protein (TIGR01451 family)
MSDKKSIMDRERESAGSQVRSIVLYLAVAMIASGFVMSLIRSVALDITKFSYAYSRILAENRSKSPHFTSTDKSDATFDGSFLRKRLSETISGLKEFGSSLYAKRDNNLDTMVVKNNVAQGPSPTTASPAPFEESTLATPEANINTKTSSNSAALKPSEIGVSSSARLPIRNTLSSPTATSSAFVQKVPNPTQTISPISGQELSGTKKPESIQVIFVDPVIRVCSYQPKKYQAKGRVDMPTGKIASLKITWQVATPESKQSLLNVVDFGLVKSGDPFNTEIPWPGINPQDKKVQVSLTAQLYDRKTAQALLTKPAESSYLWESSSSCPPPKEAKPAITHQLSITNVSKDKSAPDTYIISYRGFIKNTGNVAIDDLKSTQLVRNTEATFVSAQKTEGISTLSQNKATFTPEPLQQGQAWGYVTVARVVAKDLGIICSELESEALFGEKSITAPKSRSCFDLTEKYSKKRYVYVKPTLFCPVNTTKIQRGVSTIFTDSKDKLLQAVLESATGYYRVDLEEGSEAKVKAQIGTVDLTLVSDTTQLAKTVKYDVNANTFEISYTSTDKGICAPEIAASGSASTNSRLKPLPTVTPTPTPLPTGTQSYIGGHIWSDTNKNGMQDDGEEAISSVYTQIFNCTDALVALKTIRTSSDGNYKYDGLQPGCFKIRVYAPAGYTVCTNKAAESGSKPTKDSDVYVTGESDAITLTTTSLTSTVDACLIKGTLSTDLSLSMNANNLHPQLWENVTHIITVTNEGTYDVTGTKVKLHIPSGLLYVSHEIVGDVVEAYDQHEGTWNVGTVEAGDSKTLKLVLNVISSSNISSTAEISQMTGADVDSTPNNQITTEDDYGSVSLSLAGQVQGISDVRSGVERGWSDMPSLIAISAFIGLCMGAIAIEESRVHSRRESHQR